VTVVQPNVILTDRRGIEWTIAPTFQDREVDESGWLLAAKRRATAKWPKSALQVLAERLYDADPNCGHEISEQWSGVKCTKCPGWLCY
jgi:hypothetical protein